MSAWATINGIDVVLFALMTTFAGLWLNERSWSRELEEIIEGDEAPTEVTEQHDFADYVQPCAESLGTKSVQGFTGRGESIEAMVPRLNVDSRNTETCLLDRGHIGPHMSATVVWS